MSALKRALRRLMPAVHIPDDVTATSEAEAEAIARKDVAALNGRRVYVTEVTTWRGDTVFLAPGTVAVLTVGTDAIHWNDDFLDPVWDCTVNGLDSCWAYGRTVRVVPA